MRAVKWSRGLFIFFFAGAAAAAEVPLADFARHAQFRSVKISPDGDCLAANFHRQGLRIAVAVAPGRLEGRCSERRRRQRRERLPANAPRPRKYTARTAHAPGSNSGGFIGVFLERNTDSDTRAGEVKAVP
jgi:hypothetical protein